MTKQISNRDLKMSDVPQRLVVWNERIQEFALSFDGYTFCGGFDECAAIAEKRKPNTLTEFRTCLFFEQRRWRHYGTVPKGKDLRYLRWLLSGIRDKVRNGEVEQVETPNSLFSPRPVDIPRFQRLPPGHITFIERAVSQALGTWTNHRYDQFLRVSTPGRITEEWFHWFAADWKVARTIAKGQQGVVCRYLDQSFRKQVSRGRVGHAVDAAALYIQSKGWSANGVNGKGVLPISIVSKVGFFLRPSEIVPYDSYALKGLNKIRQLNGVPKLKGRCYLEYLDAFDELFAAIEQDLAAALKSPKVLAAAAKLGCDANALRSRAMRRKLLDDYLMHVGNYQQR